MGKCVSNQAEGAKRYTVVGAIDGALEQTDSEIGLGGIL